MMNFTTIEKFSRMNQFPHGIVLWGGTGQAKVVRPIIEYYGAKVVAIIDDTPNLKSPFSDVKIYHGYKGFKTWIKSKNPKKIGFCVTIGNPHGRIRLSLHEKLIGEGLSPITLAHPTAWIADNAIVGAGAQIMAGVIIMPEVRIGKQCIINTKVSVDHEGILEDGVEIGPGVTLCGCVHMGVNSWVCAGATVLPRIKIGENSIVGAGAVVTKNVPTNTTVIGVPAKKID